jgi:hypothetical protein
MSSGSQAARPIGGRRGEFGVVESDRADIEADLLQFDYLQRKNVGIPAGVQRQLIVGERVSLENDIRSLD